MTTFDPLTDYDIFDREYVLDPFPVLDEIRESGCPIAHTERWGGSWLPTRYEDVVAMAQEFELFTSRQILVTGPPPGPGISAPTCSVRRARSICTSPSKSI